jgi:hypothetical protein
VRQEVWAHLVVHHCLTRIIMDLAEGNGIDPDRVSFVKVLKHARRSVIRQCADTPKKIKKFLAALAAKASRKLDNGLRRLREPIGSLSGQTPSTPRNSPIGRTAGTGDQRDASRPRPSSCTRDSSVFKQRHWPGASKWNKIEHRLFSHITMNWRGRPLSSHEVVVNTITATRTRTGLRVEARLDTGVYPTGVSVSLERLQTLPIHAHQHRGVWNYTISPPGPEPDTRRRVRRVRRAAWRNGLAATPEPRSRPTQPEHRRLSVGLVTGACQSGWSSEKSRSSS